MGSRVKTRLHIRKVDHAAYSEERIANFIESLPDETLCPPWTAGPVDPYIGQQNEQGEHSTRQLEKQTDGTETWDNPAYFNPLSEGQESLFFTINSQILRLLLKAMGRYEWTGEGIRWEERFLGGEDEDHKTWYHKHSRKIKSDRCRKLLMFSHKLWLLCQETPSAHNIDQQASYIRKVEHVRKSRQLIHAIHTIVDKICVKARGDLLKRPEAREHAANTAGSLRCQIIPMLLLTLKAAFMMGSQEEIGERVQSLPEAGTFPLPAMQIMRQAVGWIKRLHLAMVTELEVNPPIPDDVNIEARLRESQAIDKALSQLKAANRYINGFEKSLTQAFEELKEVTNRPKRKREAMEEDKRIRQKREDQKQKEEEAAERQMALFRSSTQAPKSRISTQLALDSGASNIQELEDYERGYWEAGEEKSTQMSTIQGLSQTVTSSGVSRHRKRGQKLSRWQKEELIADSHQQKQGLSINQVRQEDDWSYDEDSILLTMVREASQPDPVDLGEKFPGRDEQEIEKRIGELKEMSRRRYKEWDMMPPQWCFA